LRDFSVITAVASDKTFPTDSNALSRYRRRTFELPSYAVRLPPITSTVQAYAAAKAQYDRNFSGRGEQASTLFNDYKLHVNAIQELTSLPDKHLQTTDPIAADGVSIPPGLNATQIAKDRVAFLGQLSTINLQQLQASLVSTDKDTKIDPLFLQNVTGGTSAASFADKFLSPANTQAVPGVGRFVPSKQPLFTLKSTALDALSDDTTGLLATKKLAVTDQPLDQLVRILDTHAKSITKQLDALYKEPDVVTYKKIGNAVIITKN
jgi:hypothetical protein